MTILNSDVTCDAHAGGSINPACIDEPPDDVPNRDTYCSLEKQVGACTAKTLVDEMTSQCKKTCGFCKGEGERSEDTHTTPSRPTPRRSLKPAAMRTRAVSQGHRTAQPYCLSFTQYYNIGVRLNLCCCVYP